MNAVADKPALPLAESSAGKPLAQFIRIRRDLHANPELGFNEHRTAAMVAELLSGWGYSVTTGIGGTGVVGQIQRGRGGRRVGLRADMDALPVHEKTGLAWASTVPGSCTPAVTTGTPPRCSQRPRRSLIRRASKEPST